MLGGVGLSAKTMLHCNFEVEKMISSDTQNVKKFSFSTTWRAFSRFTLPWAGLITLTIYTDEKSRLLDRIIDGAEGGRT